MILVLGFFNLTKESTDGGKMRNGANTMRVHTRRVGSCCWVQLKFNNLLDIKIRACDAHAVMRDRARLRIEASRATNEVLRRALLYTRTNASSQLSSYGRVLNLRLVYSV